MYAHMILYMRAHVYDSQVAVKRASLPSDQKPRYVCVCVYMILYMRAYMYGTQVAVKRASLPADEKPAYEYVCVYVCVYDTVHARTCL
jgi:hypothetical protein